MKRHSLGRIDWRYWLTNPVHWWRNIRPIVPRVGMRDRNIYRGPKCTYSGHPFVVSGLELIEPDTTTVFVDWTHPGDVVVPEIWIAYDRDERERLWMIFTAIQSR